MKGLFPELSGQDLLNEVMAYERHIRGDYDYTIHVDPKPTPRPRFRVMTKKGGQSFVHTYNPPEYTKYKESLVWMLKDAKLGLKRRDYMGLFVRFGIPFTQTERKQKAIEGTPHRKAFDTDNLCKALLDAMQQADIISDDRIIYKIAALKVGTHSEGYISFNLI